MLDLLTLKNEGLEIKEDKEELILTFLSSFEEPLLLDGNKIKKKIKIILNDNVDVKLFENEFSLLEIEYILKNNSSLNCNLLALNHGGNSLRNVKMYQNSSYKVTCAELSINDVNMVLNCYMLESGTNGIFRLSTLSKNNNKKMFDINFNHLAKNTNFNMTNYGVCQDSSFLQFKGVGFIQNGASKSYANQSAKIMVFSSKAHAEANPILKIDENDVSASHGAALGKINDDHLFYLMARGISEEDAKRLITLGYLNPVLPLFFDDEIKKDVEKAILERV